MPASRVIVLLLRAWEVGSRMAYHNKAKGRGPEETWNVQLFHLNVCTSFMLMFPLQTFDIFSKTKVYIKKE